MNNHAGGAGASAALARLKRSATSLAALIPRGRIGQAVRFRLISWAREAPLPLAIARGDTVVQVGAVVEGELWHMVELVGRSGRVVVVEPFPGSVEAIEEEARRRGIGNVTVVPKGAWGSRGTQSLHLHPEWPASNIVLDSGATHDRAMAPEQYAGATVIEVDRLDDMLVELGIDECDFVKITVMGAELQVLAGMERLLRGRTTVWVKAHSAVDGRPANAVIEGLLRERGYRTVRVRGNRGPGGVRRPEDVYGMPGGRR